MLKFINNRACRLGMVGVATILSLSCSKEKSKSEGIDVIAVPDKPIVFTGPTRDYRDTEVPAPWFRFSLTINNTSAEPITIIGLKVAIYPAGSGDSPKEVSFTPSDFQIRIGNAECKFSSFGTIPANTKRPLSLTNAIEVCAMNPVFIAGGLPPSLTGNNYRYRVEITPLGWFGTEAEPIDRFERKVTVYTE